MTNHRFMNRTLGAALALSLGVFAAPARGFDGEAPEPPEPEPSEFEPAEPESEAPAVDPVILRAIRSLHDPEGPSPEELVQRIQKAGALPVDDLLRFLEERKIDAYVGAGSDTDPMDGDVQMMNRYQEKLILTLLDQAGMSAVRPALERLLERSKSVDAVAAAIVGLGAVGGAGELRPMFELALPLDDPDWLDPRLERALEKGGAAILAQHPEGFAALSAGWRQLPSPLVPAVVRAIGATADGRGVELLGQVVVWEPGHAALAVATMRRLGPSPNPDVNRHIAAELRRRLDPVELGFCRAAILALAELEDMESIPQLIDLLETAPAVEENALWALQKISGQSWANSPGWWSQWYADELTWYQDQHPRMERELRESQSIEKLVVIMREYGKRRLHRSELADEVIPLLDNRAQAVRLLAIETLQLLEARVGLPALVKLLEDDNEFVRDAALRALQAMTGETHASSSPAWQALGA